MEESKARWQSLLDALPHPALLLKEGRVLLQNSAAAALLPGGALPEGLPVSGSADGTATLGGRTYSVHSAGVEDCLLLTLTPRPGREGLDRTRAEVLAEQLRLQLSDLTMAAEVLTPAVSALGEDGPDRALCLLQRALYRMVRMTRHLELAGASDPDFRPEAMDLAGLCLRLCREVDALAERAGCTLRFSSPFTSLIVTGDGKLLELLLLSLISNALKASGKGGAVTVGLTRSGSRAVLSVSDSGSVPVPPERLFDPEEVPPPGGGLGLGMALVRRIAALHGGSLLCENGSGGLTLFFSLPLRGEDAPLPLATPAPDREGGFSRLLVELSDALPADVFDPADLE